ncbi:hypothetical protein [Rhodococcus sp. BS-15]|nr:hypothetical protein [Rhodococcus sp. BS-15]
MKPNARIGHTHQRALPPLKAAIVTSVSQHPLATAARAQNSGPRAKITA